jgi:beta-glucanase (GH16 family)
MKLLPFLLTVGVGCAALDCATFLSLRAAPPAGWDLVFSDEFESPKLDATKWSTAMKFPGTHGPRYHNEFYLSYTLDEDVLLGDGLLRLRTDRRDVTGREPVGQFQYSQGLVSTHDRFSFAYGYIEIRAKYPGGKGLWPCFWLMPEQQTWPPEFDIGEYYGGQRKMHFGLAYGSMHKPQWDSTGDETTDFVNEWRTIALEWTPGRAVWYVDGTARKTVVADYVPGTPMYVILSNSVSSVLGPSGVPDEHTVFPNHFEIDYVRVWQAPKAVAEAAKAKAEVPAVIAVLP